MEKKKDEKKKGIVESFLGEMPLLGNLFKELGKTEVFQKRFKEIDEQIEENLRKGEKRYVSVEGNISIRPLSTGHMPIIRELKKAVPELSIQKDYVYRRTGNKLTLAVKVPEEAMDLSIKGKNLFVTGENFERRLDLPDYYRSITKKHYKNEILILELSK